MINRVIREGLEGLVLKDVKVSALPSACSPPSLPSPSQQRVVAV